MIVTKCNRCNVSCQHERPRVVACPECNNILRFSCGLTLAELSKLARHVEGTFKGATCEIPVVLNYPAGAFSPQQVELDLAYADITRCNVCDRWVHADYLDQEGCCDSCRK